MNIGKMRYRLQLQELAESFDAERVSTESWQTIYTFWADIRPIGGEIAFQQYGISEEGITKRVYCRPNKRIKTGLRLVHGTETTETYEICYVADYHDHYEVLMRPVPS